MGSDKKGGLSYDTGMLADDERSVYFLGPL